MYRWQKPVWHQMSTGVQAKGITKTETLCEVALLTFVRKPLWF